MRWRRTLASLNVLTTLFLLGVLFIMVNHIASRRYARVDLTRERISALSDQTRQTLGNLEQPLSVIIFYQPGHRLYELVTDLLDEYARANPTIQLERVDPQQDIARTQQLVQEFEIDVNDPEAANLVIFKSGARHKHLSDTDLAEYDYASMTVTGEPRVKAFKGEEAFTSAILSVTRDEAPRIWLTSGHGEKSAELTEPLGLSNLQQHLEQQNMTVETVTLPERVEIPADVKLVVIPGPIRRFTEQEIALLQGYLDRGGRVLILLDPLTDTGLEGLLSRWGIAVGADIVVDPAKQLPFVSAANVLVTTYSQHPVVQRMKMLMTLFPLARSVRPAEPAPEGISVTPLAFTSPAGWGETQTGVEVFEFNDGQDLKGPVPLAAAVEGPSRAPDAAATQPARLIVIGDSDFAINAQLANIGNRDLFMAAAYWLISQERLIGIGPKTLDAVKLHLTRGQLTGLFWFSFLALPLSFGLLGALMWWLRRT